MTGVGSARRSPEGVGATSVSAVQGRADKFQESSLLAAGEPHGPASRVAEGITVWEVSLGVEKGGPRAWRLCIRGSVSCEIPGDGCLMRSVL